MRYADRLYRQFRKYQIKKKAEFKILEFFPIRAFVISGEILNVNRKCLKLEEKNTTDCDLKGRTSEWKKRFPKSKQKCVLCDRDLCNMDTPTTISTITTLKRITSVNTRLTTTSFSQTLRYDPVIITTLGILSAWYWGVFKIANWIST